MNPNYNILHENESWQMHSRPNSEGVGAQAICTKNLMKMSRGEATDQKKQTQGDIVMKPSWCTYVHIQLCKLTQGD